MSIVPVIPDLQSQIRSLQQELYQRNRQLSEAEQKIAALETELAQERAKSKAVERGAKQLRAVLRPLHDAVGMVFGEIDAMGIQDEPRGAAPASHGSSEVWNSWKQRLGGAAAKIIDILHVHGQLDQTQIRIHLGTNRMQTVYDAVSKLNKAGIINKNGGKISLKEL